MGVNNVLNAFKKTIKPLKFRIQGQFYVFELKFELLGVTWCIEILKL